MIKKKYNAKKRTEKNILKEMLESVRYNKSDSEEVNPIIYDRNYRYKNDNMCITKRNKSYTDILNHYEDYLENALTFKKNFRKCIVIFFIVILGIVILALVFFIGYLVLKKEFDINSLIALVTASATLVSTLLIIPTKITEFLFNRDEEKNMSEIIKNIQDYDKNVRNGFCGDNETER
ncbi:hypothetical protein [Thomasclavelia cocleata]|jgi:hypothetical protein|uniref:hypothetical protein n=1 Tax=Thomasclavelia cocleata TaxID=69824 RepID=UPI00216E7799|nr:hypothetical protein [Thomasclavelia cocleata]MCI9128382.1 hypothetical protein [Eubacterium sp.]